MVMEHFVSPFLGIPFPVQSAGNPTSTAGVTVAQKSSSGSSSSRKNSRKRRKLSGMKRIAATTRERSRIEHLNCAFITLRSRIPTQPSDVKLTKVETLRLAMSYIMHLEKLVGDIEQQEKESTGSSEVSSTSGAGSKGAGRSGADSRIPEQLDQHVQHNMRSRVVRVYPSYASEADYTSWQQQYGLPVRPIPTIDTSPFVIKKGHKDHQ